MTAMATTTDIPLQLCAFLLVLVATAVTGFAPIHRSTFQAQTILHNERGDGGEGGGGIFGAIGDFFNELDAFVDDATSRRLGSGSAFYGKRKSSFYGKSDKNRKSDRDMPDPTEDYQGKACVWGRAYFVLIGD